MCALAWAYIVYTFAPWATVHGWSQFEHVELTLTAANVVPKSVDRATATSVPPFSP